MLPAILNAAKRRCNTIITQCKGAGATAAQITGNYDLAIDKDCIAYEKGLVKMNDTLVSNVRSASLEELSEVVGEARARKIIDYFAED